jgi:hypothetical protein
MTLAPRSPERSFGVSVGLVLCGLGVVGAWRSHVVGALVPAILGFALLLTGILRPAALAIPSRYWWRLSRALGHFNARVLLTLTFALVFVPISVIWRLTGIDPLARKRARWSGWAPYPARYRDRHHYRRMF